MDGMSSYEWAQVRTTPKEGTLVSRMTTWRDEMARLAFAVKAAKYFAVHPECATYGDVLPGTYLALRWGLGGSCVLVVKLSDDEAVNYQQLVKEYQP